jgi:hypothetical protein
MNDIVDTDANNKNHINEQLKKLKNEFQNTIVIIENIIKIKTELSIKIANMKTKYEELIKLNNKNIFLFCLDSLFFQYKLYVMEFEGLDKYWAFIYNRVYCDYYKLYGIVLASIKQNRYISINETSFPNYRSLDVYFEYPLTDIKNIHNRIVQFLQKMEIVYSEKNNIIQAHIQHNTTGMALMNFLNTLKYENILLQQEISLYINYMSFFHMSQCSQINGFFDKLTKFQNTVESNMTNLDIFCLDNVGQYKVKIHGIPSEQIESKEMINLENELLVDPENNNNCVNNNIINAVTDIINVNTHTITTNEKIVEKPMNLIDLFSM